MRRHVVDGAEILRRTPEIPSIAPVVAFEHHLRIDGTGYPVGVSRPKLNLATMLCSIADVYDAMRSQRAYQGSLPTERILEVMKRADGHQFDQHLVRRFTQLLGIYPPGNLVLLDDGAIAVVLQVHAPDPHRPRVRVIMDSKRRRLVTPDRPQPVRRPARPGTRAAHRGPARPVRVHASTRSAICDPHDLVSARLAVRVAARRGMRRRTPAPAPRRQDAGRPRGSLVVLVVDQMRYDYLERMAPHWTRRHEAAARPRARSSSSNFYPYLKTVTCAGHATIGTGAFPATHGIIMNAWWRGTSERRVVHRRPGGQERGLRARRRSRSATARTSCCVPDDGRSPARGVARIARRQRCR